MSLEKEMNFAWIVLFVGRFQEGDDILFHRHKNGSVSVYAYCICLPVYGFFTYAAIL